MNVDALAVRSARTGVVDRRTGGATLGLIVCVAAMFAAGAALVEAGSDARASLMLLPCLAIAWALAGVVITVRQHCPAGSIVHAFAAATAMGSLAWSINESSDLHGTGSLIADLAERLAVTITPALIF